MKKCYLYLLIFSLCSVVSYAQVKTGVFDGNLGIGSSNQSGSVSYDSEDQTYRIISYKGSRQLDQDGMQYLWTTIQGDFIVRAEIKFEESQKAIAGWTVRNTLNSQAVAVDAAIKSDGSGGLFYREQIGDKKQQIGSGFPATDVIQLERKGNKITLSTAAFGQEFKMITVDSVNLDNEVFIGLFVSTANGGPKSIANFRNVRIVKPASDDFRPYQDYIGSKLEILDIEDGSRKVVYESKHSIQAPNWTTDGKKLIYNSKGYLFQYDLNSGAVSPLNTGFAVNNNNDHVLSFDGKHIGISHHNEGENWNSTIYHFPVTGSDNPTRVTKPGAGASYLHGWSPDKEKMLFTGDRKGQFDIYEVAVGDGTERQLTNTVPMGKPFTSIPYALAPCSYGRWMPMESARHNLHSTSTTTGFLT